MGAPAPRVPVANQHVEKGKVRTVSERPNGLKSDLLEEAIANVRLSETPNAKDVPRRDPLQLERPR